MPLVTIAFAISLISFSLTLQANLFQLFQPIGGVLARPLSWALTVKQKAKSISDMSVRDLFIVIYWTLIVFLNRASDEEPPTVISIWSFSTTQRSVCVFQ